MVLDDGLAVKAVARELGIGASMLSTWVRAARRRRREQWWADQVTPVFAFLNDYGFVLTEVRAGDWWETAAVYRAEQAALEVVHSVEFWRVELRLTRAVLLDLPDLSHGRAFVTGAPGLGGHLADRLLVRAYPDARKRRKIAHGQYGLEADQVAAALDFWARILREHAADFLRGDLSIFDEWEGRRGRLVVKVHLPRKATQNEEAAAVGRTRAVFPDADVVTERYPLPDEEIDKLLLRRGAAKRASPT
jgi:hypothetical protein